MTPASAWGQEIHAAGCCAVNDRDCCGPLEAHHLISRGRKAFKDDPRNGLLLCWAHHHGSKLSPHGSPKAFREWMTKNRPEQAAWVEENRWKITPSTANPCKHCLKTA